MGHGPHEPRDDDPPPPPPDLSAAARYVRASTVRGVRVIELLMPQALDSEAFDALNAVLLAEADTVGDGGRCVLDLSGVEYMGSSMLGLMVNARQKVKAAGGRMVLCGMSDWLRQTFRASSLERLFVTADTRAEAMTAALARR